jgi:hypothetical protein
MRIVRVGHEEKGSIRRPGLVEELLRLLVVPLPGFFIKNGA